MIAAEIRKTARESLTGRWGKAALLVLVFNLIMFAISFVGGILSSIPLLGSFVSIGLLVVEVPIMFGMIISFTKFKRGEEVSYTDFLNTGFSNFGRSWGIVGNILLKLILLLVLAFVFIMMFSFSTAFSLTSAIIGSNFGTIGFSFFGVVGLIGYLVCLILLIPRGYLYALSFFVAYDNPNMTTKEAVEESEKLMRGHRWNLFWLYLTFIGWSFLCIFTLGLGFLWLYPYIMVSTVVFYESLAKKDDAKEVESKVEVIEEPVAPVEEKAEVIEEVASGYKKEEVASEEVVEETTKASEEDKKEE